MPSFDVKVVDSYFDVPGSYVAGMAVYLFPMVPPADQLAEIARIKRREVLPRYARVRMYYRIEYVNPTPMSVGNHSLILVAADGEEKTVSSGFIPFTGNVVEDDVDVTAYMNNPEPAFGVQAMKLVLYPAWVGPSPIPTTRYRVFIKMYGTWGE